MTHDEEQLSPPIEGLDRTLFPEYTIIQFGKNVIWTKREDGVWSVMYGDQGPILRGEEKTGFWDGMLRHDLGGLTRFIRNPDACDYATGYDGLMNPTEWCLSPVAEGAEFDLCERHEADHRDLLRTVIDPDDRDGE